MTFHGIVLAGALVVVAAAAARAEDRPAPPRRVETPNGVLSFDLPAGWVSKPLGHGVALEPPPAPGRRMPFDETIVVACEPFGLGSLDDEAKLEDLLARLRAGQLATVDPDRRPARERVIVGDKFALIVTYDGTDDSGMPAKLRIAVLPDEGRVALVTARMPARRLDARRVDLDAILASMRLTPAAQDRALAARLAGVWRSDAAPGVTLALKENGTFEETRAGRVSSAGTRPPTIVRAGAFDVIGREVRLRFDEGETRSFRIDAEPAPGTFVSAGQTWRKTAP